jgi:hypothetical protein
MSEHDHSSSTQEWVDRKFKPLIPVFLIIMSLLTLVLLNISNFFSAMDTPEVKIAREQTAQAMFVSEGKKYEAKAAQAGGYVPSAQQQSSYQSNRCRITSAQWRNDFYINEQCPQVVIEPNTLDSNPQTHGYYHKKQNLREVMGSYRISIVPGNYGPVTICQTQDPNKEKYTTSNCSEGLATLGPNDIYRIHFESPVTLIQDVR